MQKDINVSVKDVVCVVNRLLDEDLNFFADKLHKPVLKKILTHLEINTVDPLVLPLTMNKIHMVKITNSQFIQGVGYDYKDNVLQISMCKGNVYQYKDVPEDVYNGFLENMWLNKSQGRLFGTQVKDRYDYVQIK